MLCFLNNLPGFHPESLEMSRAPPMKFDCNGWAAILILSSLPVVLHKVSLFSGDRYCKPGDHFIILGCQKATLKKVELGALTE